MSAEITVDFLTRHPRDAVPILEAANSKSLYDLLATLELELQISLLGLLLPTTSAGYIASRETNLAVELITRMRADHAAQVLLNIPLRERTSLLASLPASNRQRLRQLLRYPDDSVGAAMMTPAPACRIDSTVRNAKRIVRRIADSDAPAVVVVDADSRPIGVVTTTALMKAADRTLVSEHKRSIHQTIRAYDAIINVASSSVWRTEEYGVVVHSDGRFAGLLLKSAVFERSLGEVKSNVEEPELTTAILDIANLLWSIGAAVLLRGTKNDVDS